MSKPNDPDERKVLFSMSPPTALRPAVMIFGISEAAWQHMQNGRCHDFDLGRAGVDLLVYIYGAPTRQAAMDMITTGFKVDGETFKDDTKHSYEVKDPPEFTAMMDAFDELADATGQAEYLSKTDAKSMLRVIAALDRARDAKERWRKSSERI